MELLEQGDGFGFVFSDEDGGELGGERDVAGMFGERGPEQGFGVGVFFLLDERVGEAADGLYGIGVSGEQAAIGGFGAGGVSAGFGEAGGQERVLWGFGRQLEGVEQVAGGLGVVGMAGEAGAVDLSEGAPDLSEGGVAGGAGIELGGGEERGTGVGELAGAGEQEAERGLGGEVFRLEREAAAVERDGVGFAVLLVGDEGCVKEGAGVVGMVGEPGVEQRRGGLPVAFGESGFGAGEFGAARGGIGAGLG